MSSSCTHVTSNCPVEYTLYGYRPDLGANVTFAVLFAVLLVLQVVIGTYTRTWTYTIAVSLGILGELLGYIGRLIMHSNPWDEAGLDIQIVCLVIAPSFLAAGIYLTLKHVVLSRGEQYSRLRPKTYPRFFIGADVGSVAMQAIGGGIAASGGKNVKRSLLNAGDDMIEAGIALQVATMVVFVVLAADYCLRRRKALRAGADGTHSSGFGDTDNDTSATDKKRFWWFVVAMSFAYVTIMIRCIYRLHEMAGGWGKSMANTAAKETSLIFSSGNPNMRHELVFLIMDGMFILLACVALTVAHPGYMFPIMGKRRIHRETFKA